MSSRTPYQIVLWDTTRTATRNRHRDDASTLVTMIGEIGYGRYRELPTMRAQLRVVYQEAIGVPPASRDEDWERVTREVDDEGRGPNPHPTRSRPPGELD
jgi:hypothetical protein